MQWGGGISSAVSRALGAGDQPRAQALALHAAVIGIIAGLLFSAVFTLFGPAIIRGLGGEGAVLKEALVYANMVLTASILIWLLNTFASILRGTGNMRPPSLTIIASAFAQIVLGAILGLGFGPVPRFGLAGVGAALVIVNLGSISFLLWYLRSGRGPVRLLFDPGLLKREMFIDILKVGALSALGPLQSVLTVLILTALVARYGAEALAGYGIGARLEFMLIPIVFSVGVASLPLIGMAIGARDIARARKVAWSAGGLAALVLGVIGITVTLAPDLWSGLFTSDAAVRASDNLYLRWAGPGFAFLGLGLCLYFSSQGAGRVLGPVLAGTLRLAVVALGGYWLSVTNAPAWTLFALVSAGMVVFGLGVAVSVRLTPWGARG